MSAQDISFYSEKEGDFKEFSNYYILKKDYSLKINGQKWASVEHYYQAQKFTDETYKEIIRNAKTANIARILATQKTGGGYKWRTDLNPIITEHKERNVKIREDWEEKKEEIMEYIVQQKFSQNPKLLQKLKETKDLPIFEASPRDDFWGIGKNNKGLNKLGKILEKIREQNK